MIKRLGTIALCGMLAVGLLACEKSQDKKVDAPTTKDTPAKVTPKKVSAKPAIDEGMVSVHLQRLATKMDCANKASSPWCKVEQFTSATKADLPTLDKFPLVGLTLWVPTKGEVDVKAVYPATFAYRDEAGARYGELVRIKNKSAANAHHVKGMVYQVKQVLGGASKTILITEKNLFGYLKRRAAKAKHKLVAHDKGWQVTGGNKVDIRKVGDVWVAVHTPNLKKGEAPGVHVSILQPMSVTNKLAVTQDVAVDKLSKRLGCGNSKFEVKAEAESCKTIEAFKTAVEVKKPKKDSSQLFVGPIYRVRGGVFEGTFAVQTAVGDDGRVKAAVKDVTNVVKGAKGKSRDKVIKAALTILPAELTRQSGSVSRVHQAIGVFETHPGTKTYTYMRQSKDKKSLYVIVRDPMGGLTWYGTLNAVK